MSSPLGTAAITDCTVYKIGGSLLREPDFASRLESLLAADPTAIVIVGGGSMVDVVREWHNLHPLSQAESHDLAVAAMSLTARLVQTVSSRAQIATSPADISAAHTSGQVAIIDIAAWLSQYETATQIKLQHNWDTTSDSLAVWLAFVLGVKRLVLVKSADCRQVTSVQQASQLGFIDQQFLCIMHQLDQLGYEISIEFASSTS